MCVCVCVCVCVCARVCVYVCREVALKTQSNIGPWTRMGPKRTSSRYEAQLQIYILRKTGKRRSKKSLEVPQDPEPQNLT